MAERVVRRGDDAPIERVTANPGERRDTGGTGPERKRTAQEFAQEKTGEPYVWGDSDEDPDES